MLDVSHDQQPDVSTGGNDTEDDRKREKDDGAMFFNDFLTGFQ